MAEPSAERKAVYDEAAVALLAGVPFTHLMPVEDDVTQVFDEARSYLFSEYALICGLGAASAGSVGWLLTITAA